MVPSTQRAYRERIALLPRLPRDDPRVSLVIVDTVYMAPRAAITAGSPADAFAASQLAAMGIPAERTTSK